MALIGSELKAPSWLGWVLHQQTGAAVRKSESRALS